MHEKSAVVNDIKKAIRNELDRQNQVESIGFDKLQQIGSTNKGLLENKNV